VGLVVSLCSVRLEEGGSEDIMGGIGRTSQFVAVKGTREKSHPSCEGRSEVRRMYLERKSAYNSSKELQDCGHTGLRVRLCFLQSQTIDFAYQNPGMAVSKLATPQMVVCAGHTEFKVCVRNYILN
jgi:hypothetical protein